MTNKLKGKHVTIMGRRWFDTANGNTYHVVRVFINQDLLVTSDFTYGYENHYKQTAFELLQQHGFVKKTGERSNGMDADYLRYTQYIRDNRKNFLFTVTDHDRKKDLLDW